MNNVNILIMSNYTVEYKRINSTIVKACLSLTENKHSMNVVPIVVLDVSGSMAGNRIKHCIVAIQHLLSKIGRIHLLTYNSVCYDHGIITSENQAEFIVNGMTSFRAAYESLVSIVSKNKDLSQVIFMTDGDDTVRKHLVKDDRAWLKRQLARTNCIIHTIGIECESHTQHMLDLSRCGSVEGTYGYFSSNVTNSYIQEVDRLISIIGHCTEVEFRGNKYFIASDPIGNTPTGVLPIEIYIQDSDMNCGASNISDEISYLSYRVNELIRQGVNAKLSDIQTIRQDAQLLFDNAGKQPRVIRKKIRDSLFPIHDLICDFYQMLNNRTYSHEKLALLNVAARNARSDRFTKKVVDRTDQNLAIIEREDSVLLTLTSEIEALDLSDQPNDFTCMLTCMDVADLLRDGDCLGIGIRATVRETCIVDPTLLKIDGISTSQFGSAAFLEAAEYASKKKSLRYGDSTNIVVDSSRNEVSGVLPLYLNPTHWKIAKLYLRRMAGHLCCKDPLLGTNRIIFYTYLHAYRFCRLQKGEFCTRMAGLLRETLEQIYLIMPSIIPTPNSFCSDISQRMPDIVPSVTLLEEAYCALSLICDCPLLQDYMIEETLRRKKYVLSIQNVCIIDTNYWIQPFIEANIPNESSGVYDKLLFYVSNNYHDALSSLEETIGDNSRSSNNTYKSDCIVIPDPETYIPVITLPPWMNDSFVDLSLERKALIALQLCNLSNVTTCVANYTDIFTLSEEEVRSNLCRRAIDYIDLKRSSELTAIITNLHSDQVSTLITRLNRGVSLLERVAILHGNCYLGRNISKFLPTTSSFEELKMLLTGTYDIAPLINYHNPVPIPTVVDLSSYHSSSLPTLHPVTATSPTYNYIWLPNRVTLKKLCQKYSHSDLMSIIPQAKFFFDKYCS